METLSQTAPLSPGVGRPGAWPLPKEVGPRGGAMRFYVSGKWGFTLIWGFLSAVMVYSIGVQYGFFESVVVWEI